MGTVSWMIKCNEASVTSLVKQPFGHIFVFALWKNKHISKLSFGLFPFQKWKSRFTPVFGYFSHRVLL